MQFKMNQESELVATVICAVCKTCHQHNVSAVYVSISVSFCSKTAATAYCTVHVFLYLVKLDHGRFLSPFPSLLIRLAITIMVNLNNSEEANSRSISNIRFISKDVASREEA